MRTEIRFSGYNSTCTFVPRFRTLLAIKEKLSFVGGTDYNRHATARSSGFNGVSKMEYLPTIFTSAVQGMSFLCYCRTFHAPGGVHQFT